LVNEGFNAAQVGALSTDSGSNKFDEFVDVCTFAGRVYIVAAASTALKAAKGRVGISRRQLVRFPNGENVECEKETIIRNLHGLVG